MLRLSFIVISFLVCSSCTKLRIPGYNGNILTVIGSFKSQKIKESSGLAKGNLYSGHSQFPEIIWTHNDSPNSSGEIRKEARIFPLFTNGTIQEGIKINGAENHDWEDIAFDYQNRYLIIGDIGDNRKRRDNLSLYVIKEPDQIKSTKSINYLKKISFFYPESLKFDAEALFCANRSVYLLTKQYSETQLFKFKNLNLDNLEGNQKIQLTKIGKTFPIGGMVTGGDISRDKTLLAVLTYHYILLFSTDDPSKEDWFPEEGSWKEGKVRGVRLTSIYEDILWETQYEGICFINNDRELLISSENIEGEKKPMIKISINDFQPVTKLP